MSERHSLKDLLNDPSKLHYEFPLKDRQARYKELCLYIADACVSDPTFSKLKLLKILFYSDFESYGLYREPITGVPYKKMPYGPCPVDFERLQQEMVRDRLIRVHRQPVHDYERQRPLPLQDPTFQYLTARDLSVVHRWIQFFWNMSSRRVSEYSHGLAWKVAALGERIPYEAVFVSDEPITFEDQQMVKDLGSKYGWKL